MTLPKTFVWTRFGTEAGQAIEDILLRKEEERRRNGGIFLWGIGNNVGPSLPALLRSSDKPTAVFSPIKSKPRVCDVLPGKVAIWSRATAPNGNPFDLPEHSVVTSRFAEGKQKHFALVCGSSKPLSLDREPLRISMNGLVNARTGNKLGYSQVTAIVEQTARDVVAENAYDVSMRCRLIFPFVVTLHTPVVTEEPSGKNLAELAEAARRGSGNSESPKQLPLQLV